MQVNYNDGGGVADSTREDTTWQENLSDYNSDFSAPSGKISEIQKILFLFLIFYNLKMMTKKMMTLMKRMEKLVKKLNVNLKEKKKGIDLCLLCWLELVETLRYSSPYFNENCTIYKY